MEVASETYRCSDDNPCSNLGKGSAHGKGARNLFDGMSTDGFQTRAAPNRVLNVTIHKACYPMTDAVLHQVFNAYGVVEDMEVSHAKSVVYAMVTYVSHHEAKQALVMLNYRNIYDGCYRLQIEFAPLQDLEIGGEHYMFDEMSNYQEAAAGGVLYISISQVCYPVTKELLHQVYDVYGAEDVIVGMRADHVEALVWFRTSQDAERAQDDTHGRCIYDGCCVMDVQCMPSTPCASAVSTSTMCVTLGPHQDTGSLMELACEVASEEPKETVEELCTRILATLEDMHHSLIVSEVDTNLRH